MKTLNSLKCAVVAFAFLNLEILYKKNIEAHYKRIIIFFV